MSIGYRCVELGYDFIWLGSRGLPPYFITPSGRVVVMEVNGRIPYIRTGSDTCQPRVAEGSLSIPVPSYACPALTSTAPDVKYVKIPIPQGGHEVPAPVPNRSDGGGSGSSDAAGIASDEVAPEAAAQSGTADAAARGSPGGRVSCTRRGRGSTERCSCGRRWEQ